MPLVPPARSIKVVESELEHVRRVMRQTAEAQLRNPLHHYSTRVRLINYGDCYFFKPLTLEQVEQVDVHLAARHHNESFKVRV